MWTLPEGATDTHFHVFGPVSRFPYAESRRYEAPEAPYGQWRAMADTTGMSRGVVVQSSVHGRDNAAMVNAVEQGGGSLRGVAVISPSTPVAELHALADAGVVGARFSILGDRPGSIAEIEWAGPVLARLGWSLDLHISPQALVDHEAVIRSLPVPVVIDHMANLKPADGLGHRAMLVMLELLREDTFWVKIAAVHKRSAIQAEDAADGVRPYADVVPRARALVEAAPDQVLWGTDYPHANIFDPGGIPNEGDLIDLIPEYATTDAHRRRLLVDNPARLYGFAS
jgi:2-pyrone-4,6-dicarboxylate lactonase